MKCPKCDKETIEIDSNFQLDSIPPMNHAWCSNCDWVGYYSHGDSEYKMEARLITIKN